MATPIRRPQNIFWAYFSRYWYKAYCKGCICLRKKDHSVFKSFRFQFIPKIMYGFVVMLTTQIFILFHTKLYVMCRQYFTQILLISNVLNAILYITFMYNILCRFCFYVK